MKIGIVGLGLIGGSMAKALKEMTKHQVFGADRDEGVTKRALAEGTIAKVLSNELLQQCDLIIMALYPGATIDYIESRVRNFKPGSIVTDCSGVKEIVCSPLRNIAAEHGFHFVGSHPMAGIERSGYEFSTGQLFRNASMIMTPYKDTPEEIIQTLRDFWLSLGFGKVVITTPAEHDQMIAYTSQLAHILSSAYVKSDQALRHKGFSAGSYQDLSRVAKLNEIMWTELFFDNRENLLTELEGLIHRLQEYREVLKDEDRTQMTELLRQGRIIKESIDG